MVKNAFFLIFLGLSLIGFKSSQLVTLKDFNTLMGSKSSCWSFVTDQDQKYINLFKDRYAEEYLKLEFSDKVENSSIPKILHFIWIGPKPFPESSIKNVHSWIKYHPEYQVYFWTDFERPLPHVSMKLKLASDFPFEKLKTAYEESDNFGEKSDVLRYEILHQMGGIYIDHDVECFKPFTSLLAPYELVCGLEPPHQPLGDTSITVCNNLIASKAQHEVMKKCIDLVANKWSQVGRYFQGKDALSITRRVFHRSFSCFDEAVKSALLEKDITVGVFPSLYFNSIGNMQGVFAHHSYASSWFENETAFEKNTRVKLDKLAKKHNQTLLLIAFIGAINMALFLGVMCMRSSKRRA